MVNLRLSIADFSIDLINKSNCSVALEEGFFPFLSEDYSSPGSTKVHAHSGIPAPLKVLDNPIYSAEFEGNCLWEIGELNDGVRFHVFSPTAPYGLQQVADLNSDLTVWNIYSEPISENGEQQIYPLLYPMGPLVMYYLTVKYDAIMIHGSGVSDNGNGRIFTGVSGQGKTTMAKLWFNTDAEVLNDDRLIVRKESSGYRVYNTPMFYADKPRTAKLAAIYSIYHSPSNSLTELDGAEAVSAVTPNLIQHGYNANMITHHLNFVGEMIDTIPIYKLGFVPDSKVVQKVKDASFEQA